MRSTAHPDRTPEVTQTPSMKPYEQLQAAWRREDLPYDRIAPGAEADVAALSARYAVELPVDFRDYLLHACPALDNGGGAGGGWDGAYAAWWGLDRICSVAEEHPSALGDALLDHERATALFFADHMDWSCAWAICWGPGANHGKIVVASGRDRIVADDFASFVDQFLADWRDLY